MSSNLIRAYAAMQAGAALQPYQFDAGELLPHQIEVKVEYCGLCHSDLSVIQNDWQSSVYPAVAGHEIIGTVTRLGAEAKGLKLGQRVGIGWTAESCQHCAPCISGRHADQRGKIGDGFINRLTGGIAPAAAVCSPQKYRAAN